MRGILSAILALFVGTSGCLSSCQVIGGGVDSVLADPVDDVLTLPVDGDDAVVGIDWPEGGAYGTLQILYEAEKETTFANNDPVETPTHFGALTLGLTQGTLAQRLTYRDPCTVGPALACYYADGGDGWTDTGPRATLKFMHDGTGMTCYTVDETALAATQIIIESGTNATSNVGFGLGHTGANANPYLYLVNGAAGALTITPSGDSGADNGTIATVYTHGTARTLDGFMDYRTPLTAIGANSADYSAAPSTATQTLATTIGRRTNGTAPLTGYIFAIACYDALHSATEISAIWSKIEARTGVLPQ